jgi:cytoskeletal protein CcmA (bactofilin family)
MFGKKTEANVSKSSTPTASTGGLNTLVEGTSIEGQVVAKSDIRIDGTIIGNLNCDGKVIIGETGFIEGKINCVSAVIQGRFEGTLNVKEMLNVRQTAIINGEISTDKLVVESGAVFNVTCQMGKGEIANGKENGKGQQVKRVQKEAV